MALKLEKLFLDVLEADPATPVAGEVWCGPTGLGPKASETAEGWMSLTDKTKLNNMSANGSGDDWISGLVIAAQQSGNQTVAYTSGSYMVNGILYSVAVGGNYDLANGFGGVNHYTALSANQRAIVLIYVDAAQVIKSVAGASSSSNTPPIPTIPADVVCLAFVLIAKASNGNVKNITPPDVTDCRLARRASLDEAVKINANDTTSGFLRDKLSDNGNVHFAIENADANETLKADVQFGTSATTACVGDDSRLSNSRAPNGSASGDLSGSYPGPTVAQASKSFALSGVISPTSIGADQNNYAPTGLVDAVMLRLTSGAAYNITGLAGGAAGRVITVHNIGAYNLTLVDESSSSTAANRFAMSDSQNVILIPDQACILQYDATSSRWRLIGTAQHPYGTAANTICQGNDARLSDGRTDSNALHKATAGEISAMTEKATPIAGDLIVIEDSAAGNAKKKVQIGQLPAGVATLSSSEATATDSPTTNSTSYTLMTGMTLTPGAGTYLVMFSTSVSNSTSNGEVHCCLYANSVQIAATESKTSQFKANDIVDTAIQKVVTVTAGQAIELKWKVVSGTGTARARVLTLLKIG